MFCQTPLKRHRHMAGTSLIELLVVIVIFLVGILAIAQVFPGGFRILRETRGNTIATQLGQSETERIKGRNDQLPEMILPTNYTFRGSGVVVITADIGRTPNDMSPRGDAITQSGILQLGGTDQGEWSYLEGANTFRRVIGEGGKVPAPRPVGTDFGGLMILQFAPLVYNAAYPNLFQVYGNDMVRRFGQPNNFRVRPWEFFVDDADEPTATLYVPVSTTAVRSYRVSFTAWINNGGPNPIRRDIVDAVVTAPANPAGGWFAVTLDTLSGLGGGESFLGAEYDTFRCARRFEQVVNFTPGEPYEYKLLDSNLGVLLFNPAGYNYVETRPNGRRVPLVARASYDVYDWRILREDFRVPSTDPRQQRLILGNLLIQNHQGVDSRLFPGLGILVQDGAGGTEERDFLIVDLETGGVIAKNSFSVDRSAGTINFIDGDAGTAGLQLNMIYPGDTASTVINADGRTMRAMYMAVGDWAVQMLMAPARFFVAYDNPGIAQYYVGTSTAFGGLGTRVYFAPMETGKKVTLGQVWYRDAANNLKSIQDQDFIIRGSSGDPLGRPFVDIRDIDPDATQFDFATYGYAVRDVRGASISVRVLWNPSTFRLGGDSAANLEAYEVWTRTRKRSVVETFLQRSDN